MKKVRAQKKAFFILLILIIPLIVGSMFAHPCFSYALGNKGTGLSSLLSRSSGGSSGSSALGGLQESIALYKQGDSKGALMKKAETCPFRQMYISGASKEGSLAYNIGKKVDELYKSMGGTSTEVTGSDCEICNVLAGAVGGESYQQYQQQLSSGTNGGNSSGTTAGIAIVGETKSNNWTTASSSGVTVYTTPGCVHCDRVKQFLTEKNVPFTTIDVTKDTIAGQEMIAKTGQTGVPVTVINGQYVVGDNLEAIEKLLATSPTSGQTSTKKTTTTQSSAQKTTTTTQSGTQKTSTAGNGATFSVATTTYNTNYTLADGIKKDLAITIWYPSSGKAVAVTGAPYPLVVFSHGMLLGSATQSRFITQGLAAQGYIVCATTHEDSLYYRGTKDASPLTKGFNDRPLDVQAIITEMLRLNDTSDSIFYGTIDKDAIGVMGHSLGGWTTELVCGGTLPGQESYADKRVKAGVLFDPASLSPAFSNIHIPMMCFFGGNSFMKSHGNGNIYASLNPPKYVVTVSGLSHMDFSDLGAAKPGAQAVLQYTIAFFDRYLKGNLSAEQTLQTKHQTFASYEYDLGEGNDGGNTADTQESVDGWEEIPAYGSELEAVSSWQEDQAYSTPATDTAADDTVDFAGMLGTTNNTSSEDNTSTDQSAETEGSVYCEDGVCYPVEPENNTGTDQSAETEGSVYCEDGVCYPVTSETQANEAGTQSTSQVETQTAQSFSQIEQEVLRLINQHRLSKGLPALKIDATLTNLAVAHSQVMAKAGQGPNHDGAAERFQTIRETLGGFGGAVAENSYSSFGFSDHIAEDAVARWLGSSGHKVNIENSKFTLTGIGVACSSQGEYYFTQIFFENPAGKSTSGSGSSAAVASTTASNGTAGYNTKPSVTVYTASGCIFCNRVKGLLKENNVQFKEIEVPEDKQAVQEMFAKSGQTGVPVTEINGTVVVGFNEPKIKELLGIPFTTDNRDDIPYDILTTPLFGTSSATPPPKEKPPVEGKKAVKEIVTPPSSGTSSATPPPEEKPPEKKTAVKEKSTEEIAQDLFKLVVNRFSEYQEDARLTELAVTHSREMAQKNQGCNYDGIEERFGKVIGTIPGHYYAEVVAGPYKYSNDLAEKVVAMWMARADYVQVCNNWRGVGPGAVPITGIGVARSSTGNYYFTQITWGKALQ